jgi:hypothetical protein
MLWGPNLFFYHLLAIRCLVSPQMSLHVVAADLLLACHVKDVLAERFAAIEEIRQYIICDETGASGVSNPHSHAVVVLREALNFTDFKKFWDLYELPKYGDIESCKNLKQAFKYCSKEDNECDFAAIDADYLHLHVDWTLPMHRSHRI